MDVEDEGFHNSRLYQQMVNLPSVVSFHQSIDDN